MSKIYCESCENFTKRTGNLKKDIFIFESCSIVVDDYFSPIHSVNKNPAVLNAKNDCSFFRARK